MARRKTGDKKAVDKKNRAASPEANVQADDHSIAFEELHIGGNVGGDIRIGHTIGYTADQVSILLKQITTTLEPKKFDGRCPYKGLEVFEEEDAELFFGRERLVNELVGRVKESRTVFITGPSGSGKSSLVRAGLIHVLKQAAIKGSDRWLYETMKPGREPLKDLALAFSRLKSPELEDYFLAHITETDILNKCAESVLSGRKDQRFVLFIDQFEEVFTQISGEEERVAFINMLAHAGTIENGRVIVLFAMRSDFVSNCATYPALNELLSQEFRQIGAMQPEELVNAIALPARHVGLPIEDELIARIINDMKGEPDALPLMQFALKDLFDAKQTDGGVIALTLADYLKHGGIHKSLERHADATFAKLSENEQELTRSIFSGLIEIGRGTQDTKRTALFDELIPANAKSEDILVIVQKLADARLIITDEQAGKDTVTISHEKLIEAWPWLKKLVNENRDVIALQNEIASDAKEWDDHNRDVSYLYSGVRLANVREQLEAKKLVLSETSHEFVIAGQAQQQRNQRTRILGVAVPIGLVIVAVILFSYISSANSAKLAEERLLAANTQLALASTSEAVAVTAQAAAEEAQKQAMLARAGELAADAVSQDNAHFDVSLLLSVEAFRTADTSRARNVLLDKTLTNPELVQYLPGRNFGVASIAFSQDGKTLASGNGDNTISLWDAASGQPIGQPLKGHNDYIDSVAFSPDGKILASGSVDNIIILWDVITSQPIGQPVQGAIFTFHPNNNILAATNGGEIIFRDVRSGQPTGEPIQGHSDSIYSIAFSQDGKILASGSSDGTIILWDLASGQPISQPLHVPTGSVSSVAFSRDGKILASASDFSTFILWDVASGQPIGQPLKVPIDPIWSSIFTVDFSPDKKTLASTGCARLSEIGVCTEGEITLWDVASGQPIGQPLYGHRNWVTSVAFGPDGKTLASGSYDGIILWDVSTALDRSVPSHQTIGHALEGHGYPSIAFSSDGKILASGSGDGTIILWDPASGQPIGQPLDGHISRVASLVFDPDSKTLTSADDANTIILWDVSTILSTHVKTQQQIGKPPQVFILGISSMVFSPDGKMFASASEDNTIILWDVTSGQPIGQPLQGHNDASLDDPVSVAFSPDGKILASGGGNGIILWNVASGQPIGQPFQGHSAPVTGVAFSPDGKTLASVSYEDIVNTIILWDVASGQPIGQPLQGHSDSIWSVAFSPDGTMLASASQDNTIILWDVASHQPITQPLQHIDFVNTVAFSPDGKTLASGSIDGTIIVWDLNPETWVKVTCQRVGRNFTRAEWAQYFPTENYRKTCDQWPLEPEVVVTPTPIP